MNNRTTNHERAGIDLSQRVEAFYRARSERAGQGEAFARWLAQVRGDLAEAAQYGAEPAFILHVLVCTREWRLRRLTDEVKTLQRLTLRQRALLLGGFRLLRKLGAWWLASLLEPMGSERARAFLGQVGQLEYFLTGGVVETPEWQVGSRGRLGPREQQRAVTACILCLLEELKGHPKPRAAVTVFLEKSGLLKTSRGGAAGVVFVAKRAARAQTVATDRGEPLGFIVSMLKDSFASLREFLLPAPGIPATAEIWTKHGRTWRTTGALFREAFHGRCEVRGIIGDAEALAQFERELADIRRREGVRGVKRLFEILRGGPVRKRSRPRRSSGR